MYLFVPIIKLEPESEGADDAADRVLFIPALLPKACLLRERHFYRKHLITTKKYLFHVRRVDLENFMATAGRIAAEVLRHYRGSHLSPKRRAMSALFDISSRLMKEM